MNGINTNHAFWLVHGGAGAILLGGGLFDVVWAGGALSVGVIGLFLAIGVVVAILMGTYVLRTIVVPLEQVREAISLTRSDGDLSRHVQVSPTSSVAPLAAAYNDLIFSFHSIVTRVVFNSRQIAETADHMMKDAAEAVEGATQQHAAAEAAAVAVVDMSEGVGAVAQSTEETAQIAQAAREHSSVGGTIVSEASQEIDRIASSVEQSAQVVTALGERSDAIGGIVRVIREIADQTNLLALNAAIEAARAGEQGRGFAVVADEVRKLAERTSVATSEIDKMINAIQSETQTAIVSIREGSAQAKRGAELARQAADALQQINSGAQETMENVEVIAGAMAEQNAKAYSITEHVTHIIEKAKRSSQSSQNTLNDASQLDYLAMNLKDVGTIFKLGQMGEAALKVHEKMPGVVQRVAQDVGKLFEHAVDSGQISVEELFDQNYVPIPNTKPQKYHTKFDQLADRILPPLQEPLLDKHREIAYAISCDTSGYVPTHNKRFSQPLTGDEKKDFINNRTKRIFSDPVGKRCGAHELPFLLQTYRRDTSEIMHDISAPIYVHGRHWGGLRIGYKIE